MKNFNSYSNNNHLCYGGLEEEESKGNNSNTLIQTTASTLAYSLWEEEKAN